MMKRAALFVGLVAFLGGCGATPAAITPAVGPTQTQGALAAQVGTLTAQNAALQATVSAPTATIMPTTPSPTATATGTATPSPSPRATTTSPPRAITPTAVPTQPTAAKVGETATGQGFAVTVHEMIDPAPPGQRSPAAGQRWIAFDVSVANVGSRTLNFNPNYFKLKASDNREYPLSYGGLTPPLGFGDQQPGETSRGWLLFELPSALSLATLTYTPPGSIGRVVFDLR